MSDLIKSQIDKKLINELEKLGLLDKYITNAISKIEGSSMSLLTCINILKNEETLSGLLLSSFVWNETPEGHKFWFNIASQDKTS